MRLSNVLDQIGTRPVVHLIGGTRPEAIKLAPLAGALQKRGRLKPVLVSSGQHPQMFTQGLEAFGLTPDTVVDLRREAGSQPELVGQLVQRVDVHLQDDPADAVVVQGDTSTALAAALAAFWRHVPVVHLEAGLRSFDLAAPFPEEANRRLIAQLAALHLAPTAAAAANLAREGVSGASVVVTGNTVVDAVVAVASRAGARVGTRLAAARQRAHTGKRRLLLVTMHRREAWGAPLIRVLGAVREIVDEYADVEVVLPVHPNPAVRRQVESVLAGLDRVLVCDPLPYHELAGLLSVATLVLSDSGGIQEEAPSFGVPVLVLRDVTERREAVAAGCARLVGTDPAKIVTAAAGLLDDSGARAAMRAVGNPFGDGHAAARVEHALACFLGLTGTPPQPFMPAQSLGESAQQLAWVGL